MKKSIYTFTIGAAAISLLMVGTLQSVATAGGSPGRLTGGIEPIFQGAGPWQVDNNSATVQRVCASSSAVSCDALVLGVDKTKGQDPFGAFGQGTVKTEDTFADNPNALTPAQIISAYNFPTINANGTLPGTGETIGIVDAYDDPNIASDLATFDAQFGLPALPSCTVTATSHCFQKVGETGGSTLPAFDQGWAQEISLDVEWAHAIAPGANILLVEATSNTPSLLATATAYASTRAQYVSMSWGGAESSSNAALDKFLVKTNVSFFAAAGDTGLGTQWPSTSPYVISVGGTTLTLNATGGVASETGWVNGGGGCSINEKATSAQASYPTYAQSNCAGLRATPDVAADADPNTGVYVYNSNSLGGESGWFTVGGTSLATPIWAARAADSKVLVNSAYIYGTNNINFHDITQGGNAAGCLVGYDMCSGLGSWNN